MIKKILSNPIGRLIGILLLSTCVYAVSLWGSSYLEKRIAKEQNDLSTLKSILQKATQWPSLQKEIQTFQTHYAPLGLFSMKNNKDWPDLIKQIALESDILKLDYTQPNQLHTLKIEAEKDYCIFKFIRQLLFKTEIGYIKTQRLSIYFPHNEKEPVKAIVTFQHIKLPKILINY